MLHPYWGVRLSHNHPRGFVHQKVLHLVQARCIIYDLCVQGATPDRFRSSSQVKIYNNNIYIFWFIFQYNISLGFGLDRHVAMSWMCTCLQLLIYSFCSAGPWPSDCSHHYHLDILNIYTHLSCFIYFDLLTAKAVIQPHFLTIIWIRWLQLSNHHLCVCCA